MLYSCLCYYHDHVDNDLRVKYLCSYWLDIDSYSYAVEGLVQYVAVAAVPLNYNFKTTHVYTQGNMTQGYTIHVSCLCAWTTFLVACKYALHL